MDFKDLREEIEKIIEEVQVWVKKKSIFESSKKIEKAQILLMDLKNIASNDVQNRSVLRLTLALEYLAKKMDEILSKREAGKQEDGNVAFKCNWNDRHYKAPCSNETYEFNIKQGRAWCNTPICKCRGYTDDVTIKNHPCYESIALKEMYFAAGWDYSEEKMQPRHIYSVKQDKIAVLTTRCPGAEEKDRLIIACLYIEKVQDDPGKETKIYANKEKSIEIDYEVVKINFWKYYKNAGAENLILWASGLFRYITDDTVLNILEGIGENYKNLNKDTKKITKLIKHYEDIIQTKRKR